MLTLVTPTQMRLSGYGPIQAKVRESLSYTDKKVEWTYKKFKAGRGWFVKKYGQLAFDERLAELKEGLDKNLLFGSGEALWTYSGLRPKFEAEFNDTASRLYAMPKPRPRLIPWESPHLLPDRYFQEEAERCLIAAAPLGPAGVEIGTGLGKTRIITNILKALGLPAIIMSPSASIGGQIYRELVRRFGKRHVGMYGDGKHDTAKLFTVGIAASLRNVKPGTPAWSLLSRAQVFIADESHMCPAETLQQVCFGLAAAAPYRFFFSGTQMRGDGLDLVLEAITGPIVYRKTVREGVDEGFLARPDFRMCWVDSDVRDMNDNLFDSRDANELTRAHGFYNPALNARAADLVNKSVSVMGRPTVIMVEELEQVKHLLPHLRYEARFAHGPISKENKALIPESMHESDVDQLVEDFNAGKFPILIGTSCITTGTDIIAAKTIVNLRQGKSEVEARQGVGRGTRLAPGKDSFLFIDFGVRNIETLARHAKERVKIYRDIYPSVQEIGL